MILRNTHELLTSVWNNLVEILILDRFLMPEDWEIFISSIWELGFKIYWTTERYIFRQIIWQTIILEWQRLIFLFYLLHFLNVLSTTKETLTINVWPDCSCHQFNPHLYYCPEKSAQERLTSSIFFFAEVENH